jgi:N-acetyl-alpha-D-muramate 1-phosphate uridylyltransferase
MKAMILAAGLGKRMRPLTDHLPKPLLPVGGKPLIDYHIEALAAIGIEEIIVNLAYLGEKIKAHLGDGKAWGVKITYSEEAIPLETGGGILNALPLLGGAPFLLVNGDVWTEFDIDKLAAHSLLPQERAHLILVPNPTFHPQGDFALADSGKLINNAHIPKHTFAGLSIIDPRLISEYPNRQTCFPLGEALRYGIAQAQISAQIYTGKWSDVGTPERLDELDDYLQAKSLTT